MCIRLYLGCINIRIYVVRLCLFGKYYGNSEILSRETRNAYAGRLNGKYSRDILVFVQSFELFAQLTEEAYIYLMVKKAVDLEYVARADFSVFKYSFFKKLHTTIHPFQKSGSP